MAHRRCYEAQIDSTRSVVVGYDVESDNYLIVGKNGDEVRKLCLSQEAMWEVQMIYAQLLKYQAQCAPDGVGAVL